MMFRRIAIKVLFFQFRVYLFCKNLSKNYLPVSIYRYVFIKPNICNGRGGYKIFRTDGAVPKVSRKEITETRWGREAWNSYAGFAPKSERITRRKSLNDLQGMFETGM